MSSSTAILGEWKMISSENFDEVLKEFGVGLMLRKLASTTKPNVRFEINDHGEWSFSTISTFKNAVVKFKLNEDFNEETMDGRKVVSRFTMDDNGRLVQTQKDQNGNIIATMIREITSDGKLKVVCLILFLFLLS